MNYIVLDAMGVIYKACDDVAELLYPFIVEKGGVDDPDRIMKIYIDASLGKMTAPEFWQSVGISPELEDEYLERHALREGVVDFLKEMRSSGLNVWCLSNDVSGWSKKLRRNFCIEGWFEGFVISGDVGLRKPDPAIYTVLLKEIGCRADEIILVDDNVKNVDAAAGKGIAAVLFNSCGQSNTGRHKQVVNFWQLREIIS